MMQGMNYNYVDHQPTGQEQWTPLTPQVPIEELLAELIDVSPLERQYEFCRNHIRYGLIEVFSELTENQDTKTKISKMATDADTLELKIKEIRNKNHETSLQRGYGHQNHPTNPTGFMTHEAVSYQNPQGQWNMQHQNNYGNQGYPQSPAHPSLFGQGMKMGMGAIFGMPR